MLRFGGFRGAHRADGGGLGDDLAALGGDMKALVDSSGALGVRWGVMCGLLDTVWVLSGRPGRVLGGHVSARGSDVGALRDGWEAL